MLEYDLPFPTNPKTAGKGNLISFISLQPGAGASTLASMHALILAEKSLTALIDFHPLSKVRSYMGLTDDVSSASILNINAVRNIDSITDASESYSEHLDIYPGIFKLLDAAQIDSNLHIRASTFLKQFYSNTVAVLGPLYGPSWVTAMLSDLICVVVTPDRANIDVYYENIEFLSRLGCGDRILTILNKFEAPGTIRGEDATKFFNPDLVIPHNVNYIRNCNRRKLEIKNKDRQLFSQIMIPDYDVLEKDYQLIGSLAARDGLVSGDWDFSESEPIVTEESEFRKTYKRLRNMVQLKVREQFTLEETHPSKSRNPVTKNKFNTIVQYTVEENEFNISEQETPSVTRQLFNDILGYGPLEEYFNDPDVTEIKVNGLNIQVEKRGKKINVEEKFENIDQALDLIRRMISLTGRRIDQATPEVNARLHDGSRLIAQISPIAVDDTLITIRRFRQDVTPAKLVSSGSASREVMDFLRKAISLRYNMVIAGGTGAGKTTWLNCLASFIDPSLSIITIEDPAELQLQHPDVRRLEARPANIEGKGEYTQSDAVKSALRMRPDIIICGECRREEAFDMLQAMNTGHKGSETTLHANSAKHAIARLANMVSQAGMGLPHDAILDQIADAIDLIVYVKQDKTGRRRLDHIVEVVGPVKAADLRTIDIETNLLYQYNPKTDNWEWVAERFSRYSDFADFASK